jgi:hypothetical protein
MPSTLLYWRPLHRARIPSLNVPPMAAQQAHRELQIDIEGSGHGALRDGRPRIGLAIVGRATELDTVDAFLADPETGPRALLVDGEAGIAKTTLLRELMTTARTRLRRPFRPSRPLRTCSGRCGNYPTKSGFRAGRSVLPGVMRENGRRRSRL